jgi:negative regulator of flagellin synthesis FlgM
MLEGKFMNINGIGPSKVINLYNNNKKIEPKEIKEVKKDSVEISNAGKSLISFLADENLVSSSERVEAVKNAISQGTYKPSSEAIAKKMAATLKGSEI